MEVVPQLGDGVLRLREDADDDAHRHDDEADTEDGIDLADDLVDGEEGGDEVVHQDDDEPEKGGGDEAGVAAFLEELHDEAGGAHGEDSAHHHQQHHAENAHDVLHGAAQIDAGDLGDRGAVVTDAHHAGEVVMHRAGKDGAEGDPQEDDGAPEGTLQGAEDGAETGDVQKLDHKELPLGQDHVVHAVVDLDGRGLPVIGAEGILHDLAVDEVPADQQRKTDQKAKHYSLLLQCSF